MSGAIDWTKPVETVDDKPCRLLATDLKGEYPIVVSVLNSEDKEYPVTLTRDGLRYLEDKEPFVRNVPEKFERVYWLNVYCHQECQQVYHTREQADTGARPSRIARIRVPITGHVGQFDE